MICHGSVVTAPSRIVLLGHGRHLTRIGATFMAHGRISLHCRICISHGMGRDRALYGICSVFSEILAGGIGLA